MKKLLCHDDMAGNYLVYRPFGIEKEDDDWLINIELYSEDFRADLGSIWMDEMGLSASPILHRQVRQYKRFFSAKDRRAKVAAFAKNIATAPQFDLAVMAAVCGLKDMQPNSIIRAVLKGGLDKDANTVYQSLAGNNAQNPFWAMVSQATGYNDGDDVNLGRLAIHILLTAATRTMRQEYLMGLDNSFPCRIRRYSYDFVSECCTAKMPPGFIRLPASWRTKPACRSDSQKLSVSDLAEPSASPASMRSSSPRS